MSEKKKTALVTGASGGIGEELATLFAKDGHNVVLVARTLARLEAVAERLRNEHKVEAHAFAADLTNPLAAQKLFDDVSARGLEIDFLVNNAGFGSTGAYLDLPLSREVGMIEVNCATLA